jgi:prophage antirepressor-like protein
MFKANAPYCPIVSMENEFFGTVKSIESFTNIELGSIRTVNIEGNPYFFMKDVCAILELNSTSAIADSRKILDKMMYPSMDDIHSWVPRNYIPYYLMIDQPVQTGVKADGTPAFRNGKAMVISEPALYYFIMRSNKPKAIQFQNWVYNELLPDMRRAPEMAKEVFDILEDIRKTTVPFQNYNASVEENKQLTAQLNDVLGCNRSMVDGVNAFAFQQNADLHAVVDSNIALLQKMSNIDERFKTMYDIGYMNGYNAGSNR